MKKLVKFRIVFLIICLVLVGCYKENSPENQNFTDEQIKALYQEIEPLADAILLSDNPDWSDLAAQYKERKEIKKMDVQPKVFAIEFVSGEKRGWVKAQPLLSESRTTKIDISSLEQELSKEIETKSISRNTKSPKIALINTQFYESKREFNIDSSHVMGDLFRNRGWDVDIKDGEDANLGFFANNLNNYDAIYVNGHGYSSLEHNWLQAFVGTEPSFTSTPNIMFSRTNSSSEPNSIREDTYINEDYFDNYYKNGSFPNSVIYLTNCQSLKAPNKLAPVLVNKGSKVVVGWDESSLCARDYGGQYVGRLLLRMMLVSGETLDTEFKNIDDKLKINVYEGTPANLVYYGRDNTSSGFWKGGDYKLPTETGTTSVTGVTLNKTYRSLAVGETDQLTANVLPSNATNKNVTWSSSNTSVATVSNTGLVAAMVAGSLLITVSTVDGNKKATCTVTVNPVAPTLIITKPIYGDIYHCGKWIDIFVSGYTGSDWENELELWYSCLVGEPKHTISDEPSISFKLDDGKIVNKATAHTRIEGNNSDPSFTFSPQTPSVWDGHWVRLIAHNKKNDTWSAPQYIRVSPSTGSTEIEMVSVSGGTTTLGGKTVTLNSFNIGKYEITQKQWLDVMGSYPGTAPSSAFGVGDDYPVYYVSWNDIQAFLTALRTNTGKEYRLPTEAEWEYAAKGGQQTHNYIYSGNSTIENVAWYRSNSNYESQKVGTKSSNELGIYDMSGNVEEWCSDWYSDTYPSSTANPEGATSGYDRVIRGGSWGAEANYCTIVWRGGKSVNSRFVDVGFRVVLP